LVPFLILLAGIRQTLIFAEVARNGKRGARRVVAEFESLGFPRQQSLKLTLKRGPTIITKRKKKEKRKKKAAIMIQQIYLLLLSQSVV
jgi:hypothetical protein